MEGAGVNSAEWKPLARGGFTHIDWGQEGAADGFDPYLVWAEASQFSGYEDSTPRWLPVLVELEPMVSIEEFVQAGDGDWLRVPPVYTGVPLLKALRYCTAWVGPAFFAALRAHGPMHGKVRRLELGLPVAHHVSPPPPSAAFALPEGERLAGPVFGLIDGGLAFANQAFLQTRPGPAGPQLRARTRWFWRQDGSGQGATPEGLGYGHELRAGDIEAALRARIHGGLVDEEAVYRHFELWDLRRFANHGTHVLDLACGPRTVLASIANRPPEFDGPPHWAPANDAASRADIVAVQLDWSNVVDTSGGSMNVSIMDALMYVLSRCAPGADVVVNISWGTLAGPHNGTSVLEAAMDQLMALTDRKLQIVLPAGNGYQDRLHANATLGPGQTVDLHWKVQPGDRTQSFLELWLPPECGAVAIEVAPPGGSPSVRVRAGQSRVWTDERHGACAAVIFPRHVATGLDGTCALVALAPTFSFGDRAPTCPCGPWLVRLTNTGAAELTVDAYVERDDVALGQASGARQSYFEDTLYDTGGDPASFADVPVPASEQDRATLIRRSGTFNSLGTGSRSVTVGGTRLIGEGWSHPAPYSPRLPDPDASRVQRAGVVRTPSRLAMADESAALPGLSASATLSGSKVRLVGTSGCAPLVARDIFNQLATTAPAASF